MNIEQKIKLLEQITIERGSAPNEVSKAKEKIAEYTKMLNPEPRPRFTDNPMSLAESRFIDSFRKLAQENRKKWKV